MNISVVQQHEHENEKNVDDDDDDKKIRPWADLPREILELIYSGLSVPPDHISFSSILDQFRFRLTCKTWQLDCLLGQFPFLMSLTPKKIGGGCYTFFNPITNKEIHVYDDHDRSLELHENDYISCSKFGGWLLITRRHTLSIYNTFIPGMDTINLFFYNPFIPGLATIKLPVFPVGGCCCLDSMSFTAPPTSSECIVYLHGVYRPANPTESKHVVVIHRWCYGEDHWTSYHTHCQSFFGQSSGNPILYRSVFYQLNERGRLGISDPKKGNEQHIWKDLPRPKPLKNTIYFPPYSYYTTATTKKKRKQQQQQLAKEDLIRTQHYMAECDGKLVMVLVEYKDLYLVHSVHIFELDWSRMEWVTVQSLGNKAMFISESQSLLIKTNGGGGVENKIYFPAYVDTTEDGVVLIDVGLSSKRTIGGGGHGRATKKVGVFYCLENHGYNFPPEYWERVTKCTWFCSKFQL